MKKRIVSMLTVIAIITAFLPAISMPAMAADEWDGTVDTSWYSASETSFAISTPAELAGLASLVNEGNTFAGKTVTLAKDIDLGSREWTPIGGETYQKAFQGTFDGGGHTISNLSISSSAFTFIGLFGVVSGGVKNLTVEPATVTVPEEKYGGIIAGYVYGGKLFDCHTVGGAISGGKNSMLGGITGYGASSTGGTGGTITLCSNDGTAVTHTIQSVAGYAGGIVGYNNSGCKVTGCYNTGYITGGYDAGGIVGLNSGTVSHCYNTGNGKSLSGIYPAAGICSTTLSGATTEYCHNYGSGTGDYLGIGTTINSGSSSVYGTISNCYYLNGSRDTNDSSSKQLTADEFKSLDSFVGWEATGYWKMDSENPSYPVLNPEAFYDYKINLYNYQIDNYSQKEGYGLEQTIYKNSGDMLTADDLEGYLSGYTVWTTDNSDFTDTSKHKTIDENGFLVTESMDLYAVDIYKSNAGYVTTGETYYAFAGTEKEFDLTELLDDDAYTTDGVEFTITSGGAENKVYIDEDKQTLKIADDADAGIYNLNITAERKTEYERGEIMIMSVVDFDANDLADFSLTVKVIDLQGDGTEATPYLIPSALTLEYIRDKINADTAGNEWANKYYALTADIDLNGSESNQWTPIGNNTVKFTGNFDGRGHTVSGLYIKNDTSDYQGLFGYCTGQIKNLIVEGTVKGRNYVGGVAGYAHGNNNIITACANKSAVSGNNYVGGIAGEAYKVTHSYNTGNVTGAENYVGAITGFCVLHGDYSFYLENTADKCDGNITAGTYGKLDYSEVLFKSGYIAYILNDYHIDSEAPAQYIWGQKLGTDDYPVLLTDDNREGSTVYSANFYRKFDADRWSYDAEWTQTPPETVWIDYTLANKGSRFSLSPLLESEDQQKEFNAADAWVLDMADINDTDKYITDADDEALICTGKDIALYAVEDINNAKTASDGSVTLIKSASAQNIDLKQYISADNDETLNANLTFTITGTNPLTGATVEDNNLVIPANAAGGKYVFNITATKQPVFSLMSTEFSNGTASFALTVTVIDLGENANGSAEHPYQIPDAATLAYVRDKINAADGAFISAHYELTDNIDLNNENWTPIGTDGNRFSGTFDGKGYTISGFKIEKSGTLTSDDTMIGFFKIIGENGVVKNLTLEGEMTITSSYAAMVGAIAGVNNGTITGCHSDVNITSTGWYVGGIAGQFSSGSGSLNNTITNCYNTGNITALSAGACAGGIVGFVGNSNFGVGYCYNTGIVSATGTGASADGIIGFTYGCQTARNYYLEDIVSSGYGTEKTSAQFASGEVTWLMQSGQSAQDWGQNLSENGDAYPILTSEADKKVYRIEFKKKDGADFAKATDDIYVNNTGIAELPDFTSEDEKYTFSHWTLDTDTKAAYTAGTAVAEDIVLYAVGAENYDSEETINGITIKYNEGKTKDLSECMSFADETLSSNAFAYAITGGDFKTTERAEIAATIDGDNLVIATNNAVPVKAEAYTIEITATKKAGYGGFELLSLNNDGTVTFTVNVTVEKASQTLTAPAASNITANSITLDEITSQDESVVKYAITTDPEADPSELTFATSRVFTGLDVNTTYYFYAKTDGDNNYDAAVSVRADIVTLSHVHNWEYAADGDTITATCADTDGGHGEDKTETLTISAPILTVYGGDGSADAALSTTAVGDYTTLPSVQYQKKDGDNWSNPAEAAPTNAGEYKASLTLGTYTIYVEYEIAKAEPLPGSYTIPSGISALKGKTLSEIELPDGFVWKTPADELNETGNYTAVYTPSDANYKSIDIEIPITVYEGSADTKSDIDAEVDVEELKEIAKEIAGENAADISLEMTVNEIDDKTADEEVKAAKTELAQAASDKSKVEYFTVTLEQTVTTAEGTEKSEIDSIDGMINIKIPLTAGNADTSTITVYRYNAAAEAETAVTLKEKSTAADGEEYFEVTDGYVTIHTNNFGAYAIGYDDIPTATTTPRRSSGGSSRAKATPTPTPSPSATPEPTETAAPESTATPEPTEEPLDWWYTDVPENEWYYSSIKAATDKGLMTAVKDNEFQPELDITRAMFVTVLYRIEGEPETSLYYTFEDILKDWYYEKAVAWGSANGIIAGYDEKTFAPDDKITREQMAAMLWRYAKYKGIDISIGEDTNILSFNDAENITEYAIPAIQWVCGEDIISGYTDNTLRPQANTTRAQAAVVFDKIDNIINQ